MRRFLVLLRAPDGRRLLAGGALVRPGQGATDLVVLLGIHRATGSFALGGAAVAVLTVASSISTVLQGRLIDRLGIRRLFVPMTAGLLAATGALAATLAVRTSAVVLLALAGALGALFPSRAHPFELSGRHSWPMSMPTPPLSFTGRGPGAWVSSRAPPHSAPWLWRFRRSPPLPRGASSSVPER